MLAVIRHIKFLIFILILSSCASTSKTNPLNVIKLNDDLTITVGAGYKGAGYHGTEDGNEFLLLNKEKTLKLYFEAAEGRDLKKLYYNEIPDSLPGLEQKLELPNCYLYYTNSNGMTLMNSTAVVFYPEKGDYVEVLTFSYVAEKQKEVERIASSIK